MAATAAHYESMTTIKLSGSLARKFGRLHRRLLDSGRSWEVFKALRCTLEGFEEEIRRLDGLGMRFAIFRNGKNTGAKGFDLAGTREIGLSQLLRAASAVAFSKQSSARSFWLPVSGFQPWRLLGWLW